MRRTSNVEMPAGTDTKVARPAIAAMIESVLINDSR
jgi:hypothetical protein